MNNHRESSKTLKRAFTLIELLIVIAIIAILAAMVFPITGAVQRAKVRTKARAELMQVATWIEAYKAKMGHFPADNPNPQRRAINPLFYELSGTRLESGVYRTLDGSAQIPQNQVMANFGISGFVNSMQGAASEDGANARKFINELTPGRVGELNGGVKLLVCSVPWPNTVPGPTPVAGLNPFRYNASNPTNNPGSFDLWVDVIVSGKTNRISNWSREPLIVGSPD